MPRNLSNRGKKKNRYVLTALGGLFAGFAIMLVADYYYEKHDNATVYTNRALQLKDKDTGVSCAVRCQIDEDNR